MPILRCFFALLILSSCESAPPQPVSAMDPETDVVISLLGETLPQPSARLVVEGKGPQGNTFQATSRGEDVVQRALAPGEWVIVVRGYDDSGVLNAYGAVSELLNVGAHLSVPLREADTLTNIDLTIAVEDQNQDHHFRLTAWFWDNSDEGFFVPAYQGTARFPVPPGVYLVTLYLWGERGLEAFVVDSVRVDGSEVALSYFSKPSSTVSWQRGSATASARPFPLEAKAVPERVGVGDPVTLEALPENTGVLFRWFDGNVHVGYDRVQKFAPPRGTAGRHELFVFARSTDGIRAGLASAPLEVFQTASPEPVWKKAVLQPGEVVSHGAVEPGIYFAGETVSYGSELENGPSLSRYSVAGAPLWTRMFRFVPFDNADQFAQGIIHDIAVDSQGNALVVGSIFGRAKLDFGDGVTAEGLHSDNNAFLVKFSPAGRALWARSAQGGDTTAFSSVAVTPAGDVIVAGSFRGVGNLALSDAVSVQGLAGWNAVLASYSASGAARWARTMTPILLPGDDGESSTQSFSAVTTGPTGEVYVAARGQGSHDYDLGDGIKARGGYQDLLIRYDAKGHPVWARTLPLMEQVVTFRDLAVDRQGRVSVVGAIQASGDFTVTTAEGSRDYPFVFEGNAMIAQFDPAGRLLWLRSQEGGDALFRSITAGPDGALYVEAKGADREDGGAFLGNGVFLSGGRYPSMVKYDALGTPLLTLFQVRRVEFPAPGLQLGIGEDWDGGFVAEFQGDR